jgi:hypothetical protein
VEWEGGGGEFVRGGEVGGCAGRVRLTCGDGRGRGPRWQGRVAVARGPRDGVGPGASDPGRARRLSFVGRDGCQDALLEIPSSLFSFWKR